MTDPDYTAIAILVDRSGSMATIKSDAEGGINSLIEEQCRQPGRCTVRIDQFDDQFESVIASTDSHDVTPYELAPRGMTALLDAIGRSVTGFGEELAALPEGQRPSHVIFVITTDGRENASVEWTHERVNALITQQRENYGWQVLFLAAGQDAIKVGASIGVANHSSITYDSTDVGTRSVYAAASASITRTRSGLDGGFTDDDRSHASQAASPRRSSRR